MFRSLSLVFALVFCLFPAYADEETGSLRVTIRPQEAVDDGAMWRRVGTEEWFGSGFEEDNVPKGGQVVEFMQLEGWYSVPVENVRIAKGRRFPLTVTYSPSPVPGPHGAGCRLMNDGSQPYAPLPRFDIYRYGGPVTNWPQYTYDFCAYLDTAYCSLPALAPQLDQRLQEFSELISCLACDINGPVDRSAPVPFSSNGIPDGPFELGVLGAVLNDPGHPLHRAANTAFQHNFIVAKDILIEALSLYRLPDSDTDIRSMLRFMAPHFPGALSAILAGFATLGDDQTNESMNEILYFLRGIGLQPIPGGIESLMQSVPEVGPEGDANGNGLTNRQSYEWYVLELGFDAESYVQAAISDDVDPGLVEVTGGDVYETGDRVQLEALLAEEVAPVSYAWFKDGILLEGSTGSLLVMEETDSSYSGLYEVVVEMDLLFGQGGTAFLSAATPVVVLPPDVTAPVITVCAVDETVSGDENCQAVLPYYLDQVVGEDDRSSVEVLVWRQEPEAGTAMDGGAHEVRIYCADAAGNESSCNLLFTVKDDRAPSITLLAGDDPVLECDEMGRALLPDLRYRISASDNCSLSEDLVVYQDPASGTALATGSHGIVFTAADEAGNRSEAVTLAVLVIDTLPPLITVCPDGEALSANDQCEAVLPDFTGLAVAVDNVTATGVLNWHQVPAAGASLGLGSHDLTISCSDEAGNVSEACMVTVTVEDNTAPIISVPEEVVTLEADEEGQALLPDLLDRVAAHDYCSSVESLIIVQDPDSGAVLDAGSHRVVFTATDEAGNTSEPVTLTVLVEDVSPPVITQCPDDATLSADEHCEATVPDFLERLLALDNITAAEDLIWDQEPAADTSLGLGVHTIRITCTDEAGNVSEACEFIVTVADDTAPGITVINDTVALEADAEGTLILPDLRDQIDAQDHCSDAADLILDQDPDYGTVLEEGSHTIVFTATDEAGNTSEGVVLTVVVTIPEVEGEDLVEGEELVEGEPEAVEGEPELVEGEPEAVEGEPELVEGEAEAVEGEPELVEGEAEAVEGEPELVEGEGDDMEDDTGCRGAGPGLGALFVGGLSILILWLISLLRTEPRWPA